MFPAGRHLSRGFPTACENNCGYTDQRHWRSARTQLPPISSFQYCAFTIFSILYPGQHFIFIFIYRCRDALCWKIVWVPRGRPRRVGNRNYNSSVGLFGLDVHTMGWGEVRSCWGCGHGRWGSGHGGAVSGERERQVSHLYPYGAGGHATPGHRHSRRVSKCFCASINKND